MTARQAVVESRRDEMLTVKEFACITRENPLSVYRRIRKGTQPGVHRFGREIRIDLTATSAPIPRAGRPRKYV